MLTFFISETETEYQFISETEIDSGFSSGHFRNENAERLGNTHFFISKTETEYQFISETEIDSGFSSGHFRNGNAERLGNAHFLISETETEYRFHFRNGNAERFGNKKEPLAKLLKTISYFTSSSICPSCISCSRMAFSNCSSKLRLSGTSSLPPQSFIYDIA